MDRVCLWALKTERLIAPHYPRQTLAHVTFARWIWDTRFVRRPDTSIRQGPGALLFAVCDSNMQNFRMANFTKTKSFMSFFEFQFEARHSVIALAWGLAVLA